MQQIRIHEIVRRYHLAPSQQDYKGRLDHLTEHLFREYLEIALESSGYRPSEILCLRYINIAITFEPDKSDIAQFQSWLTRLEESLKDSLAQYGQGNWVRYPSLSEAVKSIARDVSVGNLNHLWAWQRMGLIPADCDTPAAVLHHWLAYLQRTPSVGVPVLCGIGQNGTLSRLIRSKALDASAIAMLADLILHTQFYALDWQVILSSITAVSDSKSGAASGESVATSGESALPAWDYSWSTELNRDLANLIPVSDIHNFVHWSEQKQLETLKIVYFLTTMRASCFTHTWGKNSRQISGYLHDCLVNVEATFAQLSARHQSKDTPLNQELRPASSQMGYEHADFVQAESVLDPDSDEIGTDRLRVTSQYGGLLFLLNLLKNPAWQEKLYALTAHDLALDAVLQQLCYQLLPKAEQDPIVSVFSGRYFNPAQEQFQATQFDSSALEEIDALAVAMMQDVQQRLVVADDAAPKDLFARMCLRAVYLDAQPGWIHVYFKLDDIDTRIRAAGLDIDPGFLPWLGYIVKFYYE